MMEYIDVIKRIYNQKNNKTGVFFVLFLVSILYIFKKEKNPKIRTFFGYYSAFMVLIIWNPLFNYIVSKFVNMGSMYRIYFMLPTCLALAYSATKFITENNKVIMKVVSFAAVIGIIVTYGEFIFNEYNTIKVGNLYKLPDQSVEVAYIIGSDTETTYKKAIVPYEMSSHIRQIDASIELYYSRIVTNVKDENGNPMPVDTDIPSDDYDPVHKLNAGNVKYITGICKKSDTNYIVFSNAVELDANIEDYGYKLYAQTQSYDIYRSY